MSPKISLKTVIIIFLISLIIVTRKMVLNHKNSNVNINLEQTIYSSIYDDNKHKNLKLISFNNEFDISYIENTNHNSINPSFPAIHITTLEEHNAWLHIVYTDAKDPSLKLFVDADKDTKNYPFYTLEQDFFDAPLWSHSLLSKPLSLWIGHAYAIKVDHVNKTIKCVGGIEWGFKLSFFSLYPKVINPIALSLHDWEKDWIIFKQSLDNFEDLSLADKYIINGDRNSKLLWVYLSGLTQDFYTLQEINNRNSLDKIGKELKIKFIAIAPYAICPYFQNMLCWPHETKEEILSTFQYIRNIIGNEEVAGYIGFSNGGFFLNYLVQNFSLNVPVISVGAGGALKNHYKNDLYLIIGKGDKYHYHHAYQFYNQAAKSNLQIELIEHLGAHIFPENIIQNMLKKLLKNKITYDKDGSPK